MESPIFLEKIAQKYKPEWLEEMGNNADKIIALINLIIQKRIKDFNSEEKTAQSEIYSNELTLLILKLSINSRFKFQ